MHENRVRMCRDSHYWSIMRCAREVPRPGSQASLFHRALSSFAFSTSVVWLHDFMLGTIRSNVILKLRINSFVGMTLTNLSAAIAKEQ